MRFNNQSGMSLVEVMIASGIGVGIFVFLNSAMIKLQKSQIKFERRGEIEEIKWVLKRQLSDMRAYEESPEKEVPMRGNKSNFYYFENRRSPLTKMTMNEEEYNNVKKDFKCPVDMPGCRVAAFDYKGQMFIPDNIKLAKDNFVLAVIGFETPEDKIARSYLPELKVTLLDQNDDAETRVLPKMFYINQEGGTEKRPAGQESVSVNSGQAAVDPVSRANCYAKLVNEFPEQRELAKELCIKAKNSAPADCFIKMKNVLNVEDLLAIITCSQSTNAMPVECFKAARNSISVSDDVHSLLCSGSTNLEPINCYKHLKENKATNLIDMLDIKVCARAYDIAPAECLLKLKAMGDESLRMALFLCPQHK